MIADAKLIESSYVLAEKIAKNIGEPRQVDAIARTIQDETMRAALDKVSRVVVK